MSQSLTSIATSRLRGVLIGVVLGNILVAFHPLLLQPQMEFMIRARFSQIGVATTQFYTYRRKYKRRAKIPFSPIFQC